MLLLFHFFSALLIGDIYLTTYLKTSQEMLPFF